MVVTGIGVNHSFEELRLLAAAQGLDSDKPVIANINIEYTDGTTNKWPIRCGDGVCDIQGRWHRQEGPLKNPQSRMAWHTQASAAAVSDNSPRLFHLPLTSHSPEKTVRTLSLESTNKQAGLLVVAMTVGPHNRPSQASASRFKVSAITATPL